MSIEESSPDTSTHVQPRQLSKAMRRSSVWVLFRLIVSAMVGFATTAYIIRTLTVTDYGTYSVLIALVGYIGVIGSLGLPSVFHRYVPEAYQRGHGRLLKQLVWYGLVLRFALSAAIIGLLYAFADPVARFFQISNIAEYLLVLSIGVICFLEAELLTLALQGMFLHKKAAVGAIVYSVVRAGLMFWLLSEGSGLRQLIWIETISWAVWLAILLAYGYRSSAVVCDGPAAPRQAKRIARYGGFCFLNELGSSFMDVSMGFFVISYFLGPPAVAAYAFGDRVVKLLIRCMPHDALVDVIRPAFFTRYAHGGEGALSAMYNMLLKVSSWFLLPATVALAVLSQEVTLYVFGSKYLDATTILMVLSLLAGLDVFATPAGLVLQATEQVQVNLYSKIFAIYNLIAGVVAIHFFGVLGVVLVTCSAVLLKDAFCYRYARRYGAIRTDWAGMSRIVTNVGAMAGALFVLRTWVNGIGSLVTVCIAGSAVYLAMSGVNSCFDAGEQEQLRAAIPLRLRPLAGFLIGWTTQPCMGEA